MYSLRRRLTLVLAIGFVLLIVLTGVFIVRRLGERATEEFDSALLARAQALVALTDQENDGRIALDYTPGIMPEFERAENPDYFQIWLDTGQMLIRSRRLKGDLPRVAGLAPGPTVRDIRLQDGRGGRMVQLAFVPQIDLDEDDEPAGAGEVSAEAGSHVLVLIVARGRNRLDRLLARIRMAMLGIGGAVTLLAVVFVWLALAAGLRPLEQVAARVRDLDAESLDARVELPRMPRELAPVVEQINALLKRLNDSFERERRFTGNVAHELRTPVAELRSLADVGTRWPDDRESIVGFFTDARDIAGRMETMIADLLLLARCDAGVERVDLSSVSLNELAQAAWRPLASGAKQRGLTLQLDIPGDFVIQSDSGKLSMVLTNILGNAVAYATGDTRIRIVATRRGDDFELVIENAAARLGLKSLHRLTEPFWREDESRSSADHTGLGLSVVAALAGVLGMRLDFEQDQDGTFRVRLAGESPS
ncbi:MAG: ATP-binding protein [Planctomycetota bacterium]|nr:ATP-binding protein [Planctomycetota bacterium]